MLTNYFFLLRSLLAAYIKTTTSNIQGHFDGQNEIVFSLDDPNTGPLLHFPQVPPLSLQYLQELQFVQAMQEAFPVQRPANEV